MIPRTLADIGSVPDLVIGAAVILIAIFVGLKVVGLFARLIVLLMIGIGIYIWIS